MVSGTATITDASDPGTSITGLTPGVVVLEWSVDNGPCPNGVTTDQVTIEIFNDSDPLADAGPDQQLCTPATTTTLSGSTFTLPA